MKERLNNLVSLFILLNMFFAIYFQIFPKQETLMSQIIFGIIISVVVIYFIYDWIRDSIGSMKSQIIKNNEELEKLKEKFKYKEDFHKLDKRVSILEKMGKKGAVDPRIIIIIIMIILMFLYLKSQGLF